MTSGTQLHPLLAGVSTRAPRVCTEPRRSRRRSPLCPASLHPSLACQRHLANAQVLCSLGARTKCLTCSRYTAARPQEIRPPSSLEQSRTRRLLWLMFPVIGMPHVFSTCKFPLKKLKIGKYFEENSIRILNRQVRAA